MAVPQEIFDELGNRQELSLKLLTILEEQIPGGEFHLIVDDIVDFQSVTTFGLAAESCQRLIEKAKKKNTFISVKGNDHNLRWAVPITALNAILMFCLPDGLSDIDSVAHGTGYVQLCIDLCMAKNDIKNEQRYRTTQKKQFSRKLHVLEKKYQEILEDNQREYQRIIKSIEDGYYELDLAGNFLFYNDSLLKMAGYTGEELTGVSHKALMDQPNRKEAYRIFNTVYRTGVPSKGHELEMIRKDGTQIFVEASTSLMLDAEGQIIGFCGIARDITQRKRAEAELIKANEEVKIANRKLETAIAKANEMAVEAAKANKAKSEFLANMSHEIRTPMNAIIGFSDMLFDTALDETQHDYSTIIKKSGETLLTLIDDILDFSKIEAGEMEIEEVTFSPERLAYDVCELIRPRIGMKPIEILCRIGDNIPAWVKGDPARFRQVLLNLMGNAAKFTDTGEIELLLDIDDERETTVRFHAQVRDTGIGIPKDKLSVIFLPFQQYDGSTTRKYGGTGLGLSICRQISELMRGKVWAESDGHGSGSIFHFTAWLGKEVHKRAHKLAPRSLAGKKALIVDDNRANLNLLRHVLESYGMRVVALQKGTEVMPALQDSHLMQDPFHVCISDIQMPEMNGHDVARQIRQQGHEFSRLPLIAISSLTKNDAKTCKDAGFDGFLNKPLRKEKLLKMLQILLSGRKKVSPKRQEIKSDGRIQYHHEDKPKPSARILLAEDNPVNQKLVKIMLSKAGYHVVVANDGKETVDIFSAAPNEFDLIFMDVQMPVMDGLEATKVIRRNGFKTVPIVAMTAHAIKGDKEMCLKAGMNDYIAKPINRERVLKIVEKLTQERSHGGH